MHHQSTTTFFTEEDKQRHPYLSSVLEPSTQKVIATAAVRVYYAPFINAHLNWTYSHLRGILVFGRDRDGEAPPPSGGDRGLRLGHGLRLNEKYWFRLVDLKTDRVVWMFSVPEVFEYNKDKPFFHFFSGTTRMFGFCFDDDDESAVFFKKVVDRTRRFSVFRPFRINSVIRDKTTACKTKSPKTTPSSTTTVSPSPISPPRSSKSQPVRASLISSPAPHSFVHVSHVGLDTRGILESSKNIEPAWGALMADLQGYGMARVATATTTTTATTPDASRKGDVGFVGRVASPLPASPTPAHPPPEKKRKIRRKVLIL